MTKTVSESALDAIDVRHFHYFSVVAEENSLRRAAERLFMAQPPLSRQIKQLEEQLQVRLFSRSTRGVVLTSEGKLLLDYVSHGLGLIQCGEEKLAQSRQLPFKVALDNTGAIARDWGDIKITPTTYLVNKRGQIVKSYVGAPDFTELHRLIEKLLAET